MISKRRELDQEAFEVPSDVVAAVFNVYKIYKEDGIETVALGGVSLNIREKEILAVVGPSGSGKTTLLGILGGMIKPTSGIVYWSACKQDISRLNPEEVIKVRRKFIGFVFQEENLIPHLTALKNVELSAKIAGLPNPRERAKEILEKVGLSRVLESFPNTLSSGERQRVAVAAALVIEPKLVLADEPTGNLDPATSESMLELFKELNRDLGTAFFIVTHSQQVASIADRIFELRDGVFVGMHERGADLRNLDRTRIVNLDDLGRITIPSHILDQLGKPTMFKIGIEGEKIILTPYKREIVRVKVPIIVCKVCGQVIKDKKTRICPNCGSIL